MSLPINAIIVKQQLQNQTIFIYLLLINTKRLDLLQWYVQKLVLNELHLTDWMGECSNVQKPKKSHGGFCCSALFVCDFTQQQPASPRNHSPTSWGSTPFSKPPPPSLREAKNRLDQWTIVYSVCAEIKQKPCFGHVV